jgi:hypothetical protein
VGEASQIAPVRDHQTASIFWICWKCEPQVIHSQIPPTKKGDVNVIGTLFPHPDGVFSHGRKIKKTGARRLQSGIRCTLALLAHLKKVL